jgi:Predicted transcriptional regulator
MAITGARPVSRGVDKDRLRIVRRIVALVVKAQSSRRPLDAAQLASEHGVSLRTIYRDLTCLELVMPVEWRKGSNDAM